MRDFSGIPSAKTYTLQDLIYMMLIRTGSQTGATQNARITKAIQSAIQALPSKHRWNYYHRQSRFNASPEVTFDITYDRTGGSSERLVTITSAHTWPEDATYGELLIGDISYRVHRRLSDTTATLAPGMERAEDYTGSAKWQRRAYSFGREIRKIHYMHNLTTDRPIGMLPPSRFAINQQNSYTAGLVRYYSWQNHGSTFGSSEVVLYPPPASSDTYEVSAEVMPHIPTIHSVTGADLATTLGNSDVTSAGATFTDNLVGSVIRIARDSTIPIGANSEDYFFEAFILSVDSSNQLTLSETLPSTLTNLGYLISSPVDIEASVLLEALEDEAFYQYCKNHSHEQIQTASSMAQKSLMEAMVRNERNDIGMYAMGDYWMEPYGLSGVTQVDKPTE